MLENELSVKMRDDIPRGDCTPRGMPARPQDGGPYAGTDGRQPGSYYCVASIPVRVQTRKARARNRRGRDGHALR